MLAEIYLLKLEAVVRAAKEAATTASTSRFVPVTYRLRRPNPVFHRALAICAPQLRRTPSDSERFRSAPRTCHGVGGRLTMRRTDCEGGKPSCTEDWSIPQHIDGHQHSA